MNATDTGRRHIAIVMGILIALHAAMFANTVINDKHGVGDRAGARQDKISYLMDGRKPGQVYKHLATPPVIEDFSGRLLKMGSPGDYALHAWPLRTGGMPLVSALQLPLTLLSVYAVFALAVFVGLKSRGAAIAALAYGVQPGNLLQAHELVTEAIFVPVIVIAAWQLTRWRGGQGPGWALVWATLAVTAAIVVRPVMMFLMPMLMAVAWRDLPRLARPAAMTAMMVCLAPALIWGAWSVSQTGATGYSPVDADSNYHWYHRLRRMNLLLPSEDQYPIGEEFSARISTGEALGQIIKHPIAFVRTEITDNIDYWANPGSIYLIRSLDIIEVPHSQVFKAKKDQGILAVLGALLNWSPGVTAFFVVHAAAWALLMGLALWGALAIARGTVTLPSVFVWTLLLYSAYWVAMIQLAGHSRWSLRQPVEFVLVLLAAVGFRNVNDYLRDRASRSFAVTRSEPNAN